jgi:hypothetical protein
MKFNKVAIFVLAGVEEGNRLKPKCKLIFIMIKAMSDNFFFFFFETMSDTCYLNPSILFQLLVKFAKHIFDSNKTTIFSYIIIFFYCRK